MCAYATIQEFRDFTGLNSTDVPDSVVTEFIAEANDAIKRDGFVRFEQITTRPLTDPTGIRRYYLPRKYLTDGNLDGSVDMDDLQVFEYDSWDVVDITSQVATWNELGQYFTLNPGYPTNGRAVSVTYYCAAMKFAEIEDSLKKATMLFSANLSLQKLGIKKFKKGIISMSVDGLSISKSPDAITTFTKMVSGSGPLAEGEKPTGYWSYISYIKPVIFVATKIGGNIPPETMQVGRSYY